ncbi:MAG: hypothetical protein ACR2I2_10620 [Bryobacteraceae bacterium]
MKRRWNGWVWTGFGVTLLSFLSYIPFFIRFPATRDFPWVNLLLFAAGGYLLGMGLKRAFSQPDRYRGKVSGVVLGGLSLAMAASFCIVAFYLAKELPDPRNALRTGQPAPDFTLQDANGGPSLYPNY